ncbi:acyl-CoA dehydrogenase [Streptomyces sp. NPDC006385]|uniref:acyl-CoA dehydrogenase n=1 Tax=Streptomyces sp. NPDC006385 TaxID=3156761 RepID=UPI0033AEC1EF
MNVSQARRRGAPSARSELDRLINGPCDPAFLEELRVALVPADEPGTGTGEAPVRRLRRLARLLPPARDLYREPAKLAALQAWAAVADPALSMAALIHYQLCLGSLVMLGPEPDRLKNVFEALETGRVKGCYLITEVGSANSHLATRTEAAWDPRTGDFVLHTPDPGAAKFGSTGPSGGAQIAVVLARLTVRGTDCGVFAFAVDLTDERGTPLPGVEMSSPLKTGTLPLDHAQVRFHRLRLPAERWLSDSAAIDEHGTFHDPLGTPQRRLQRTLCVGQSLWGTLPSAAAAVSRQSAFLALRYARHRPTQGRLAPGVPLLQYRTQQHAVLGAFADAFALTCAAGQARELWAASMRQEAQGAVDDLAVDDLAVGDPAAGDAMSFGPWAAVSRPLAAYKAHAVRTAARVVGDCQDHCGFSGHLDVNRLPGYHGFFRAFEAAGGDCKLILFDLGRALAAEEYPRPASMELPGEAGGADWWAAVCRARERALALELKELKERQKRLAGSDFDCWNPLLGRAGELGEAYAERLAAEDTARVPADVRDPELRATLEPLAALHGVLAARRRAGSLLACGVLDREQAARLPEAADRLCDALLPRLPLLEEAFGHPQEVMTAPLGEPDYQQALAGALAWRTGGDPA